jgi:hypothetical protein
MFLTVRKLCQRRPRSFEKCGLSGRGKNSWNFVNSRALGMTLSAYHAGNNLPHACRFSVALSKACARLFSSCLL